MKICAIIVAAGRGLRAGGSIPKQFQGLGGEMILSRTVSKFQQHPEVDDIVVVIDPEFEALAQFESGKVDLVHGGATRAASVGAGLTCVPDGTTHVLIHDGARPCVSDNLISSVVSGLRTHLAVAPGLAVTDALWSGADGIVKATVDRSGLFRAQTPQGFKVETLRTAHESGKDGAADDVALAVLAGLDVLIVPGDENNLKITSPGDFDRAARILEPDLDIRTGTGFDVHRFTDGTSVTLCGVEIPFAASLSGHSDADVAMHALTDAIYGALADGDIGQHFPPSDPQWKGAASDIFLRHAVKLATSRGFRIANLDCTIICENPKIGPHALSMREKLAEITEIEVDRISVKATTTETLGFTGRGEGIAAQAAATLVST